MAHWRQWRTDLLSAWLGQHLPAADMLPFGTITDSPYDESDYVVFEGYGTIDHLGPNVAAYDSATT